MFGHIAVKDSAPIMCNHEEAIRNAKGGGLGVSLFQLLDEGLHVGRDYIFRGLLLLFVGIDGGLDAPFALKRR